MRATKPAGCSLTLLALGIGARLIDTFVETFNVDRGGTETWPLCWGATGPVDVCYAWKLQNSEKLKQDPEASS